MRALLVSGGRLDESVISDFLSVQKCDKIIGIDRGMLFLHEHGIRPDLIVGDFDSLPAYILEEYRGSVPIREFCPEKDYTDTEIGIRAAIEMGADGIILLGATGTRLDHVLGNIQTLCIALEHRVEALIQDSNNRIRLLGEGREIRKEHMFGKYISLLPLTTQVEGLTLKGFKYPLEHFTMTSQNSLGISNELVEDRASISFDSGILIMIESKD